MPPKFATGRRGLWRATQRWGPSVAMVGSALIWLAGGWSGWSTAVVVGVLLALAWLVSPWFFPRSGQDAPSRVAAPSRQEAGAAGVPVIYWRPGCVYCVRLRLALGRTGKQAVWVDVTQDDDASARVRSVTGGDETVPTVFVNGSAAVNPAPAWVRSHLTA